LVPSRYTSEIPWLGSRDEIQRTEVPLNVTDTLSPAWSEND
jgi:hypothetical protein